MEDKNFDGVKLDNKVITPGEEGLVIKRYFTTENSDPFSDFNFERRSSVIKNHDGSLVFRMEDVEVPDFWTQVATDVLAQKYFRKAGVPLRNEEGELLLDESGRLITGSETSIKQVAHRIAGCWRHWGEKYGYFASEQDARIFYEEILYMITAQIAAPNSPQWFTTGLNWAYGLTGPAQGHSFVDPITKQLEYSRDAYTRSQPHACFIQSVNDDLVRDGGIFSLLLREARIFKYGSGTGSNFSRLRGKGELLSGGGSSSGLMSFLKIFDVAAGSIKSGGTTRRAAKMVCLDLDHPEIENFIWWKVREEEKVASLVAGSKILKQRLSKLIDLAKNKSNPLEDSEVREQLKLAAVNNIPLSYLVRALNLAKQGYNLPLQEFDTHYESEAYLTVSGQNSNNSVRIPNEFFTALEKGSNWNLTSRTDGSPITSISAKKLWEDIAYCAWASADPGIQYDTTINEWHTCPEDGRINGSNPCSEYMFLDDTACNLASINLVKFYDDETNSFDVDGYRHTVRLWTIALEISVLMAHFPSENIAVNSFLYRTLGLGYANIGSLLMLQGVPYDSDEGRSIAGALAAIMTGDAYSTSAELARVLGSFENYSQNKQHMLRVIRNHRRAAYNRSDYEGLTIKPKALDQKLCPEELLQAAHDSMDRALDWGEKWGYRNAQVTLIAPTGTIGLVMDCDTTGVEPDYALVKFKKLAGGGFFKIVNQSVPRSLKHLGYDDWQVEEIIFYCLGQGTLIGSPYINRDTLMAKGLTAEILDKIEIELRNSMDIRHVFNPWNLGQELYHQVVKNKDSDFLQSIGFSKEQINAANEYICGTMTVEGAPHLSSEHYPIFDCANKCGRKGTRYIHPYGHLKVLSAIQPFMSGAISKTINMPPEWTVEQIKQAFYDSWEMMIKAVAIYRDGSKLSQPLNATLEESPELKQILEDTKSAPVVKAENQATVSNLIKIVSLGNKKLQLAGRIENESLISVNMVLEGVSPAQEVVLQALTNTVNLGLQLGLPAREIAARSLNLEGNPLIKELGFFLEEYSSSNFNKGGLNSLYLSSRKNTIDGKNTTEKTINLTTTSAIINLTAASTILSSKDDRQKCGGCGAVQLRQSGTCMLCEICGQTTGCS